MRVESSTAVCEVAEHVKTRFSFDPNKHVHLIHSECVPPPQNPLQGEISKRVWYHSRSIKHRALPLAPSYFDDDVRIQVEQRRTDTIIRLFVTLAVM